MTDTHLWLKPEQITKLREAAYNDGKKGYLQQRNDAIIAVMYDAGLRPSELCGLTTEMFHADSGVLRLPTSVQKDYPNSGSPPPATIKLGEDEFTSDTVRTLKSYLNNRWKDSQFMFPSNKSPAIRTRGLRNMIQSIAVAADVRPYKGFEGRGEPGEITPYTFRHSVAYRLLDARKKPATMREVRNRLRHSSVLTTERNYEHFQTR